MSLRIGLLQYLLGFTASSFATFTIIEKHCEVQEARKAKLEMIHNNLHGEIKMRTHQKEQEPSIPSLVKTAYLTRWAKGVVNLRNSLD